MHFIARKRKKRKEKKSEFGEVSESQWFPQFDDHPEKKKKKEKNGFGDPSKGGRFNAKNATTKCESTNERLKKSTNQIFLNHCNGDSGASY
jgi:hypothetical protein